jgi:hypothetical protein
MKNATTKIAALWSTLSSIIIGEQDNERQKNMEADMLEKSLIALIVICAMGFLTFHFIRLLLGRKSF